jgi:hypothetical protein
MRHGNLAAAVVVTLLAGARVARADSTAGTNSAEFLRFGAGTPTALSEAAGSVDRGATALFWNPAGMADQERSDAYLAHMSLPMGVGYDYFGVARPVASGPLQGTVGANVQLLTQGSIDKYDAAGRAAGAYSSYDVALGVGWARVVGDYRFGVGLKAIQESIDGNYGQAPALDLGAQRDLGRLRLGAALLNLGPELAVASEHFPLPRTLRLGGVYSVVDGVDVALDLTQSEGRGNRFHIGAKARLWGPLSAGVGYMGGGTVAGGPVGISSGIMLDGKTFRADLTYRPYGDLGEVLQVGLGARFGASRAEASPSAVFVPR